MYALNPFGGNTLLEGDHERREEVYARLRPQLGKEILSDTVVRQVGLGFRMPVLLQGSLHASRRFSEA